MLQIQLSLQNVFIMHFVTVRSCSLLPPRHCSFIQVERVDNGLGRATIGKQRHNDDNELLRFAQTFKHRSLVGIERLPTRLAFVSLAFLPMTDDVAHSDFPSCRTVQILLKMVETLLEIKRSLTLLWKPHSQVAGGVEWLAALGPRVPFAEHRLPRALDRALAP